MGRSKAAWLFLVLFAICNVQVSSGETQHPLEGRVVDEAGMPVRGVQVRPLYGAAPPVPVNRDGRFRFAKLHAGEVHLLILAKGKATRVLHVEVPSTTGELQIVLAPVHEMRFRVVDAAGQPIPEVEIYNEQLDGSFSPIFRAKTDAEGRAVWSQPPDFPVEYIVAKPGFAKLTAQLTADGNEQQITLPASLRFTGAIKDADSGEPVKSAQFTRILNITPIHTYAYRRESQTFTDGEFDWELRDAGHDHLVQIEALGYETVRIGPFRVGDENQRFDLPMKPAPPQTGRIVGVDGKPTGAAQILLASKYQSLSLDSSYRVHNDLGNLVLMPSDDGQFEIFWQLEPYTVLVLADQGIAEVRRAAGEPPGVIQLQPWAKVRGTVRQDGRPVVDSPVSFDLIRDPDKDSEQIDEAIWATTSENGEFQVDRVPPLRCRITPFLHFSAKSSLKSARSAPLELQPGEEVTLEFGEPGVKVYGQLALDPPAEADFDYHFALNYFVALRPGVEPPASLKQAGFTWSDGWNENWRTSREGFDYLKTLHHHFVKPDPDGRLAIHGVAPGEYDLAIKLYDKTEGCLVHPRGERVLRITVPEEAETLDLGEILVPALVLPQRGAVVEDFTVDASQGKTIRLSEFRGQYVLLDFWASWCSACIAKFDDVESVRKKYADHLGLAVLGMNLDAEPEQGRRRLAELRPLPWRQAFLGDWSTTDLPQRFAVTSVPAYVLIDPEGRLVERTESISAIETILADLPKR